MNSIYYIPNEDLDSFSVFEFYTGKKPDLVSLSFHEGQLSQGSHSIQIVVI